MIPLVLVMRVGKEQWTSCVVVAEHWDGRNVGMDKADPCSMLCGCFVIL